MAQNVIQSLWERIEWPWLCLRTALFSLIWMFSFVSTFLTSLVKLMFWLNFSKGKRQAEDMAGGKDHWVLLHYSISLWVLLLISVRMVICSFSQQPGGLCRKTGCIIGICLWDGRKPNWDSVWASWFSGVWYTYQWFLMYQWKCIQNDFWEGRQLELTLLNRSLASLDSLLWDSH